MDKEETTKEFKKILRDEWKQNRKIPKHMRHSESSAEEKKKNNYSYKCLH